MTMMQSTTYVSFIMRHMRNFHGARVELRKWYAIDRKIAFNTTKVELRSPQVPGTKIAWNS